MMIDDGFARFSGAAQSETRISVMMSDYNDPIEIEMFLKKRW